MTGRQIDVVSVPDINSTAPLAKPRTKAWMRLVAWLFSGRPATESVATSLFFQASSETVWQRMLSYEEVSRRPPFILRALLPLPLRTEGDKTSPGADIRCLYGGGDLTKRITVVDPPHLLEFEVIKQRLGIESCITALGGSYRIRSSGGQAEIVLTTNYRGFLQPRYVWRSLERLLAHRFHRHILEGMRDLLPRLESSTYSATYAATRESSPSKDSSPQ
jgi:hypothetical protein